MLKIAGAILIFLGAVGLGSCMNRRIRQHYHELIDLKELILLMGNEMRFLKIPLPQIMKRTAKQTRQPFSDSLLLMAVEMEDYKEADAAKIWREIIAKNKKKYLLEEDEFQIFLEAGNIMLHDNSYMQGEEIKLFTERISYKIQHAQEELLNKQRVCRYLSTAGGIFLILMLL
jgi:stage III sporulation protein AB